MDRSEALQLLPATITDDRLRAARNLARTSIAADLGTLQSALVRETNKWVKNALTEAISSLSIGPKLALSSSTSETDETRILEQTYAQGVEETTKGLLHEIRPILGRLDVYAAKEFENYKSSQTKKEWLRLKDLLAAIDTLSQVAASPPYSEFDLAEAIAVVAASSKVEPSTNIQFIGPKPMVLVGAKSYLELILDNAIRNAIEASTAIGTKEPVVITWGFTDVDYWIAVLDSGKGLPAVRENIFDVGTTTKEGHLGMGLALAFRASASLNGKIELLGREGAGARFEFRWPKFRP
jgi:signal transduction histidine kinase